MKLSRHTIDLIAPVDPMEYKEELEALEELERDMVNNPDDDGLYC